MTKLYQQCTNYFRQVNWTLLLFLVLMLNVKLIIKAIALLFILVISYRSFTWTILRRQRLILFYAVIVAIACINFLLQIRQATFNYSLTALFGLSLWIMAAVAGFFIFSIIQKDTGERLHRTVELFFLLHIAATGINLLLIIVETGALNPYTYKGMNQKYFISTGDFIRGIGFDSPVSTAMISAFALLYFLYRERFIFSLLAMGSLLLAGSNLTNIFVLGVLAFAFLFKTNRLQKSVIALYIVLFILFVAKVSPQNNEYMGRFAYKMIGRPYDLPKKNDSPEFIKKQPDSLLGPEEKRKKIAKLFIDSISATSAYLKNRSTFLGKNNRNAFYALLRFSAERPMTEEVRRFYNYRASPVTITKILHYRKFFQSHYNADSLQLTKGYNWDRPGKWIAGLQLVKFFEEHPAMLPLGTGINNFSSRTAFKATGLDIAGAYPAKYNYISPSFLDNHLFTYIFYHTQPQPKHAAENTPDSTYYQLLSEYGIVGILAFLILYAGYFIKRLPRSGYGIPLLLLLLMAFSVEYWFEQLSIVVLAELLLFLAIADSARQQKETIK
jgi:hypothetical protein